MEDPVTSDNPSLSLPKFGPGSESRRLVVQLIALVRQNMQLIAQDEPHASWQPYIDAALSQSTRRAYASDVRAFLAWGGSIPASPSMVARHLADQAPYLSSYSLQRRLAGLKKLHALLPGPNPNPCSDELVRATLKGIKRLHAKNQRRVDPLLKEDLLEIVDRLPPTLKGMRDRALLLIGFAGAFRRSELVGLKVDDLQFVREGLLVQLRRSKTDQQSEGRTIAIPFARSRACPVQATRAWLDAGEITDGFVFRSVGKGGAIRSNPLPAQSVAMIVKERAAMVGLRPEEMAGHSLRSGLITSAAKLGVSSWKIRQQSGHRSDAVLNRYIRDGELFTDNAAGAVL